MNKIIILFLFCFICIFTKAQDINDIEFFKSEEINFINTNILSSSNNAFMRQLGESNNVLSFQQNLGEHSNQLFSDQNGINNNGFINQTGTSHATGLVQKGNYNDAQINSTGQSTLTEINQSGDWNKVKFSIENKDDLLRAAQVLQTGNNNLVDLKITGNRLFGESDAKDAVVTQTGNNHSFSAVLDSYKSPVVINQQAGPNGEGMKVDISASDFYFPMK